MKNAQFFGKLLIILAALWSLAGCNSSTKALPAEAYAAAETPTVLPPPYVDFTLQTVIDGGKLAYQGIGGEIDGMINPDLIVQPGDVVRLILLNGDGMQHDLYLPDFKAKTEFVSKIGESTEIIFEVGAIEPGSYVYYCTVPGHRQAGQEGVLIVTESS